MELDQQISPIRRTYNQWVGNQTLEDYSLRFTSKKSRVWSSQRVALTATGAISFLALEAIGGSLTLHYGFTNTFWAIVVSCITIFLLGMPICYHAARNGIDIDLLTRGAGFGYIGSTITSLIYASFTFIFFALEAAIMAMALKLTLDIPLSIGYVISSIVVIPLVTHGITFISRFQVWTQPLWLILQLLPLICIAYSDIHLFKDWTQYEVKAPEESAFSWIYFGIASGVLFSLVAQIGEQVDFLRFLPAEKKHSTGWKIAMMSGGPGWVVIGIIKLFIGSFLAWLAFSRGLPTDQADDPTTMYQVAFSYLTTNTNGILILVGVFVILSQLKINVTNAYAGSIAWSNFFSRVTRNHPGRVVWLVFNVAIALMLMEMGIYRVLEDTLAIYAIIALAWFGCLVADLVICRSLRLRPQEISFKRADLYEINPVGLGSMTLSTIIGLSAYVGSFGELLSALSCYLTLLLTFIFTPLFAWLTKGEYYSAKKNPRLIFKEAQHTCCVCEVDFEPEDMSYCPAYRDSICSLCCSLDMRCEDMCKTKPGYVEKLKAFADATLPQTLQKYLNSNIGHFALMMVLSIVIIAAFLFLIYFQISSDANIETASIVNALWKVAFLLLILAAVVSWLFVLLKASHKLAHDESKRQTLRLKEEIEAHTITDKALQEAKEHAEAANQAKSRYLTGISHELRSPLNSLLGYAQLLEKNTFLPNKIHEQISAIRGSGEYLSDLIEGLLDISKIEAGRLEINTKEVHFRSLLEQVVDMFRVQAEDKGIQFHCNYPNYLPEYVKTDEKRLRQILINLLSNAIKFTPTGSVSFSMTYRTGIATFTIRDTGVGISDADKQKIFDPFHRIVSPNLPNVPGTGLGLTITKLLTEIMGGDLTLESEPNTGTVFTIMLMVPSVLEPNITPVSDSEVVGFSGEVRRVMVVDDDASHRKLIVDILEPLGFVIYAAASAEECIELLRENKPDIFLLDVSMPGMSGWELATWLRDKEYSQPVIMISADAGEGKAYDKEHNLHNEYLVKPLKVETLLGKLGAYLDIDWVTKVDPHQGYFCPQGETNQRSPHSDIAKPYLKPLFSSNDVSNINDVEVLKQLAEIGYKEGLSEKLDYMEKHNQGSFKFIQFLRQLTQEFQFTKIRDVLESIQ